jgi:hypothetical protein
MREVVQFQRFVMQSRNTPALQSQKTVKNQITQGA